MNHIGLKTVMAQVELGQDELRADGLAVIEVRPGVAVAYSTRGLTSAEVAQRRELLAQVKGGRPR